LCTAGGRLISFFSIKNQTIHNLFGPWFLLSWEKDRQRFMSKWCRWSRDGEDGLFCEASSSGNKAFLL
jgi:hypothetical protein